MIRYFLYYMLMAGVVWDSNPNGALRAIKEMEKSKQIIEGKKDEWTKNFRFMEKRDICFK